MTSLAVKQQMLMLTQRAQLLREFLIGGVLTGSCILFGVYYYRNAILPKTDLGSDQASHSYWGLLIYSDLLNGRWLSALFDSYRQVYWPFLHSWTLAASYFCLGPNPEAGRIASLVPFLLSGLVLAYLAWHVNEGAPPIASITAAGLWWTAGSFAVFFGTESLIESLAIALTLISFAVFRSALKRRSTATFSGCGLLVMCTYFAKTDYGLILLFAFVGTFLWMDVSSQERKKRILRAFFVPVFALSAAWFLYLPKIAATARALVNRPQGPPRWSIAGVLYHPQQLMRWCDEPWMFVIAILCLVLCISLRRDAFWKAVLLYVGISAILHTISQTKDQKHIVKLLPLLFLCVAVQTAKLHAIVEKSKYGRWLQAGVLVLLVGIGWLRWGAVQRATASYESKECDRIRESIAEKAKEAGSSLLVGAFASVSSDAVRFTIMARQPDVILLPDPYKESFLRGVRSLKRRLPVVGLFEASTEQSPTYEMLQMPLRSDEDTADAEGILAALLRENAPESIFVIALDQNSPLRDDDYKTFVYAGDRLLAFLNNSPFYSQQDDLHYQGFSGHIIVYKHVTQVAFR